MSLEMRSAYQRFNLEWKNRTPPRLFHKLLDVTLRRRAVDSNCE